MNFIHFMLVACFAAVQRTTQNAKVETSNVSMATTSITTFVTTSSVETEADDVNATTEMTLMTTCEANSSCFISTIKPDTNDTSAKVNTTNISVSRKHHRIDVTTSGQELCTCNLQVI